MSLLLRAALGKAQFLTLSIPRDSLEHCMFMESDRRNIMSIVIFVVKLTMQHMSRVLKSLSL